MRLLVPAVLIAAALVTACSSESTGSNDTPIPTVPGQGGATPPLYEEPLQLTDGDYLPADFPFDEVWGKGVAAAAEDAKKETFTGTVAGVRLYSLASAVADPSIEADRCVVKEFRVLDQLDITYLPGGTWASGPQFAGICEDGAASFVMREFVTKHGSFDVIFSYGEPALGHEASASRVSAQRLGDHDGVVISPVIEEGFGRGWAAVATEAGLLVVDGRQLPLEELVKIAGGVQL